MSEAEARNVKAKGFADAEWIARNLSEGAHLREQAIYSGVDRSGKLPRPVDWKALVERFTPILENQVESAAFVVEETMSSDDAHKAAAQVADWLKKLDGPQPSATE